MPLPTFESTGLPLPAGLATGTLAAVNRTEMDDGFIRQLPRFGTANNMHRVNWDLKVDQLEDFETFFKTTLENGTGWFEITLPTSTGFETLTVRFVGGQYDKRYRPVNNWDVNATLEEQVVQTISPPTLSPLPLWYRPELALTGSEALVAADDNALLTGAPPTGEYWTVTIPAGITVGVRNTGLGGIVIVDEDGDAGTGSGATEVEITGNVSLDGADAGTVYYGSPPSGYTWDISVPTTAMIIGVRNEGLGAIRVMRPGGDPGPTPPALVTYLASLSPWALFDASSVVETSGSITQLTDLSGNSRHLTDSQTGTARMTLTSGEILGSTTRSFIGDFPSTTTLPADFHAFVLVRMTAAGGSVSSGPLLGCTSAPNGNYGWQYGTDVSGNINAFGGFGSGNRCSFIPAVTVGDWVLFECVYKSAGPLQNGYANGTEGFSSFGMFAHANFNWDGIRLNTPPGSVSGRQPLAYKNLVFFDTTGGQLSRATREAIFEVYAHHYPAVARAARYIA